MPVIRKTNQSEFDAVIPFLSISENRIKMAKAYIVEGRTMPAIGEAFGCSRQAVNDAVTTVWRKIETYRESQRTEAAGNVLLPPGWESVTLIAPSHLVSKFRLEIAQAAKENA